MQNMNDYLWLHESVIPRSDTIANSDQQYEINEFN